MHRLANALTDLGRDEVTVWSLTPGPSDARYTHSQIWPQRPSLRRATLSRSPLRWTLLPLALNAVPWKGADVVHVHGDDWFFVRRGVPTVRTLHGSALSEARAARTWPRRLTRYGLYPLEHVSSRLATVSLAVGPETRGLYRADGLADNGVDPARFYPGAKSDRPTVLYVGTWGGRKRGEMMFDSFVNDVLPVVPNAELVFVADHLPVAHPSVRYVPFPDDEALAALFREAWVFAYPSAYEGFGIPYVEAMASGTAVVSSSNPGAGYVLEGGCAGAIVADTDFGSTVAALLTDDERRVGYETAGVKRAQRFSWDAVARAHRETYVRAIQRFHGTLS